MTDSIKETLKRADNNLHTFVRLLSLEELNFVLNRYCGRHNLLLREKLFHSNAKDLQRLVNNEITDRMLCDILADEAP